MALKKRVIPCLDVKDGRIVKGISFVDLVDAGDPVEAAKGYDEAGADELCFLDITASHEERSALLNIVENTAKGCFLPLTVGGGVREINDIRDLMLAGADKVSINSAAVRDPSLVAKAAQKFGSQAIVVAVDARRTDGGDYEIFTHGGRRATGIRVEDHVVRMQNLGAGEILLTSMDADGGKNGYDLALTKCVSDRLTIPVIASGGAGKPEHFVEAVRTGGAEAVLAASLFHFGIMSIASVKKAMLDAGLPVRYTKS